MDEGDQTGVVQVALVVQPLVVRQELRKELGQEGPTVRRSDAGNASATRRTAIAGSGGCVTHDVSMSRGARGFFLDCQIRRLPTSSLSLPKMMCGNMPLVHCPRNSARNSPAARSAS